MEDKQCRSYLVFYIHSNRQNYKPYMYIGNTSFLCMSTWLGKKSTETNTKTSETENMRQRPAEKVNWWDNMGEGSEASFYFIKTQESQHPFHPTGPQDLRSHRKSSPAQGPDSSEIPPPHTHFHSESNRTSALFRMEDWEWRFPRDPPVWDGRCERGNGRESLRTGRREEEKKIPLFLFSLAEGERERKGGSKRKREGVMQSWLAQDQQQQKHLDNRTQ